MKVNLTSMSTTELENLSDRIREEIRRRDEIRKRKALDLMSANSGKVCPLHTCARLRYCHNPRIPYGACGSRPMTPKEFKEKTGG